VRAAGHEPLLIDAQSDKLPLAEVKKRVEEFAPDFLVIPTAPSYLFWRCPPPELRVPAEWFAGLGYFRRESRHRPAWLGDGSSDIA
jgi:anaerobic magnesium-protoporphyrin IX monomethyl ester cyclase